MFNRHLVFKLSNEPIMIVNLDTVNKKSAFTFITSDEIALYPILQPQERSYLGLQKRFQYWFQTDKELSEFIEEFKHTEFLYPGQAMLRLEVTDI